MGSRNVAQAVLISPNFFRTSSYFVCATGTRLHGAPWPVTTLRPPMKSFIAFFALAAAVFAQDRPAPIISPEVQSDGHVIFRLRAPQAGQCTSKAVPQVPQNLATPEF